MKVRTPRTRLTRKKRMTKIRVKSKKTEPIRAEHRMKQKIPQMSLNLQRNGNQRKNPLNSNRRRDKRRRRELSLNEQRKKTEIALKLMEMIKMRKTPLKT